MYGMYGIHRPSYNVYRVNKQLRARWGAPYGLLYRRRGTEVNAMQPQTQSDLGQIESMIAEAAYYKALARGFIPGTELSDWLEAEQEIKGLVEDVPIVTNTTTTASTQKTPPAAAERR